MSILPVGSITAPAATPATRPVSQSPPQSKSEFSDLFKGFVQSANQQQVAADKSIQQFASGETNDIQSVAMTMAKADLSFRLVMEIRNKLMDAYQEIMRMQV